MTSILEKRHGLHRQLSSQQQQNIRLRAQIDRLEPLANLGTASYMIAHEINNLLAPMLSYTELAMNNPQDRELADKALGKASAASVRVCKVMESLLSLARGEKEQKEPIALGELVEGVFECLCRDFGKDRIRVEIEIDSDLTVEAVPVQLQQVIMNLIINARQAMLSRGGVLTIKASRADSAVQIEVADSGCGIEPNDLERVFESFFSTKTGDNASAGVSGSGLGLALCKKVIEAHDGAISVKSTPGEGTRFKITLPAGQSDVS